MRSGYSMLIKVSSSPMGWDILQVSEGF